MKSFDCEVVGKAVFEEVGTAVAGINLKENKKMPIEYLLLKNAPYAREKCKRCGGPFPEFMRGIVQSRWRRLLHLPYCAVICHKCKNCIGWEKPAKRIIKRF